MSDLQCPAMVVLIALENVAGEPVERVLAGRTVAGMFLAAPIAADDEARAAAARRASARGCALEILADVVHGAELRERIDALSDLHRGETICVVAPSAMIADALGRGELAERPVAVVVAIDSSGWTVRDR